jgi:DNA-binding beta-propeller fold protein YncE
MPASVPKKQVVDYACFAGQAVPTLLGQSKLCELWGRTGDERLGAARYVERAGALALAVGVAVVMSAQPAIATSMPASPALNPEAMSTPNQIPASGGWIGVITALLVALGRRPTASAGARSAPGVSLADRIRSIFRPPDKSSAGAAAPVPTPRLDDAPSASVATVTGVGQVGDIALSPDGRYAYVAARRPDRPGDADAWTISVVDTTTNTVTKTIGDLADVVPASLAVSPDSSRLYIADRDAAAICVVDIGEGSPTRNRVVDSLRLEGSLPVGYGTPTAIALSPNGSRLYALMTDRAVLIVDPDTRVLVGTVSGGDSIAMFAAGERIYVCADDRLGQANVTAGVVILEADTGIELGSFGLSDAPAFIRQPILAGGSGQLYLDTDDLDGRLEVVDTSTLNVVGRIKIDASADRQLRSIPAAAVLSPDSRFLYVANQGVRSSSDEATEVGWVSVVDTQSNEVIHDIALPEADERQSTDPQFIAIGPDGDRLVVVNEYGIASIIDVTSESVVSTVTLGRPTDQPRAVVVNPARNAVYVGGDAGLTVIPL